MPWKEEEKEEKDEEEEEKEKEKEEHEKEKEKVKEKLRVPEINFGFVQELGYASGVDKCGRCNVISKCFG